MPYSDTQRGYGTALELDFAFRHGNSLNIFCTAVMSDVGPERKKEKSHIRPPPGRDTYVDYDLA